MAINSSSVSSPATPFIGSVQMRFRVPGCMSWHIPPPTLGVLPRPRRPASSVDLPDTSWAGPKRSQIYARIAGGRGWV